ncbi:MAG TPA: DUF72 domain-containing protein [Bacteroidales bacterium]|nr:DUF72 domain-containing protein [Bacteroidales bacterium]
MERYIGCSGYYYNHWKGLFYPDGLAKTKWLIFYSDHFNTVELNNSFYRMPQESAIKNWYSITPDDFVFSVKGYRYFTHLKRLIIDNDFRRYFKDFMHLVSGFKEKTGPVLWQFPGSFRADAERLSGFCKILPSDFFHVFEFRHQSWFNTEILTILEKYGHSLCTVSSPGSSGKILDKRAELVYIRFHGEGFWYRDNYSNEALEEWKHELDAKKSDRLYAYFNNDMNAYAVNNALFLKALYENEPSRVK